MINTENLLVKGVNSTNNIKSKKDYFSNQSFIVCNILESSDSVIM